MAGLADELGSAGLVVGRTFVVTPVVRAPDCLPWAHAPATGRWHYLQGIREVVAVGDGTERWRPHAPSAAQVPDGVDPGELGLDEWRHDDTSAIATILGDVFAVLEQSATASLEPVTMEAPAGRELDAVEFEARLPDQRNERARLAWPAEGVVTIELTSAEPSEHAANVTVYEVLDISAGEIPEPEIGSRESLPTSEALTRAC